jgi:hypothetical protein
MPHGAPDPSCPVGRRIPEVLVRCFEEAEEAMARRLDRTTIADVIASVSSACQGVHGPLVGVMETGGREGAATE